MLRKEFIEVQCPNSTVYTWLNCIQVIQYDLIALHSQTIGYVLLTVSSDSSLFSGLHLYYSFTKLIIKQLIQVHIGMSADSAGAV